MKLLLSFLLLLLPFSILSELHNYEDIRSLVPDEYMEQFDLIIDDTSVCEEETNRKLIVLASHFDQQESIRDRLINNARLLEFAYRRFIKVSQRIHEAKLRGQQILANRTQTDKQQYLAAVKMDTLYSLEMSALLEICETLGFKDTEDIIRISLANPPKVKQLAVDLETFAVETERHGWEISEALHGEQFVSRRRRADSRQSFLKKYPKAMQVHDHVISVLSGDDEMRSPIHDN